MLFAGVGLPAAAIRAQLASAVDAVIHVGRGHAGIRRVRSVAEVALDRRRLELRPLLIDAGDGRWSVDTPSRPRRRVATGGPGDVR
ncbi:MAG: hypothetical protein JOZ99_11240 [Actinobacteria bacterium]|nr:hypothetical protein [Actinomycetota bacterium]